MKRVCVCLCVCVSLCLCLCLCESWTYYLHQGGYILCAVCLFVFVCVAELHTNFGADSHETWWRGVAGAKEESVTFWSGSKLRTGSTNSSSLSLKHGELAYGVRLISDEYELNSAASSLGVCQTQRDVLPHRA